MYSRVLYKELPCLGERSPFNTAKYAWLTYGQAGTVVDAVATALTQVSIIHTYIYTNIHTFTG